MSGKPFKRKVLRRHPSHIPKPLHPAHFDVSTSSSPSFLCPISFLASCSFWPLGSKISLFWSLPVQIHSSISCVILTLPLEQDPWDVAESHGLRLGGVASDSDLFNHGCKLPQRVLKVIGWWSQQNYLRRAGTRFWGSRAGHYPHPGCTLKSCQWIKPESLFVETEHCDTLIIEAHPRSIWPWDVWRI